MASLDPNALVNCKLAGKETSAVFGNTLDFGTTRDISAKDGTQQLTKGVGTPVFMVDRFLFSLKFLGPRGTSK